MGIDKEHTPVFLVEEESLIGKKLIEYLEEHGIVVHDREISIHPIDVQDQDKKLEALDSYTIEREEEENFKGILNFDTHKAIFLLTRKANAVAPYQLHDSITMSEDNKMMLIKEESEDLKKPEKEFIEKVGKSLRLIRKLKKLTLKEVSRSSGLSVSFISKIEVGRCSASLSTLYKISNALGIEMASLFSNQDNK